jgi:hypothetical protein
MSEKGFNKQINLRTEAHVTLKTANHAWNVCVSNKFLPDFFAGKSVNINEVCESEYTAV